MTDKRNFKFEILILRQKKKKKNPIVVKTKIQVVARSRRIGTRWGFFFYRLFEIVRPLNR